MPTCGNLLWCGVYTRLGCWVILTKNDEFAQVPDAPKPCFGVGQRSVYSYTTRGCTVDGYKCQSVYLEHLQYAAVVD
ncbi:uncharacterized protein FFB20_02336 [Fusarium fujikuroi]|nr:uncharacterized protein FFB20_02336 [Fusarium fujikuroi]SCN81808.1 uncharacterized protein FFE2_04799 [Fusarium fujikuroi]SCN84389.1 uncharacterized protein FFM5_03342 [Fusarium fujikuroi]SCN85145.1 uncharacterized protein FFC1_04792 [Fusarium fujikuroi]SCO34224.1 uncharacterized protein FFNC_03707 [Fusarium fujikuroi]